VADFSATCFHLWNLDMQYWLMKSEPDEVSIDDLAAAPGQTLPWFGVRNYQARNFLRDGMKIGDQAFFYHSGCAEPGIAGICEICSEPYPDATQFAADSPYFDASSSPENSSLAGARCAFCQQDALSAAGRTAQLPGTC
jgi:predicted RNA-binding protein with PUA-like domain